MVSPTSSFVEIDSSQPDLRLVAMGEWIMDNAAELAQQLQDLNLEGKGAEPQSTVIDVSAIQRLDTSGAWLLERFRRSMADSNLHLFIEGLSAEH